MSKQIVAVMDALEGGPATSSDIADETGLSVKTASKYLSDLCAEGYLQIIGTKKCSARGNRSNVYEIAPQQNAAGVRATVEASDGGQPE